MLNIVTCQSELSLPLKSNKQKQEGIYALSKANFSSRGNLRAQQSQFQFKRESTRSAKPISVQEGIYALSKASFSSRGNLRAQQSQLRFKRESTRSAKPTSVQEGIYALSKADNYVLRPVSQKFPQSCLRNSSAARLIDDGPFSSFPGRLPNISSFFDDSRLLQAISGLMSLALLQQVIVSPATTSQHFLTVSKTPAS